MTRNSERDVISFANLVLSLYARTELSGKVRGEGGTSLPGRVGATMGVIMFMSTLATDDNTRMGRTAISRVETQWGN